MRYCPYVIRIWHRPALVPSYHSEFPLFRSVRFLRVFWSSKTGLRHARQLLLWAQGKFLSLRAVHVPGVLNLVADFLSRHREWILNSRMVDPIWEWFGAAEVDLFASQESTQCPLWFSLSHPNFLEIDALAHPWPDMKLYAFPPVKLIPAVLCRVKTSWVRPSPSSPVLAFPDMVLGVGLPSGGRSMGYSVQERPAMSASGHPCPEIWKLWVWPIIGHKAHLSLIIITFPNGEFLNPGVWFMLCTQLTARLVKWRSFWLERPQPPWEPTLRLSLLEGTLMRVPLARNRLVSSFMRGAKRLRPVRPPSFTSWDLSVVLKGLLEPPFEPLESAPVRILTLKVTLLLALCWQVFWSVMGQVWQRVSLACVVYRSHCVKLRSVELPMKENVLGYLRNPCSPSREWDAASAAKLLLLSTCFFDRKIWGVRWRERGSMSNTYGVPVAPW